MKHGKKYSEAAKLIERGNLYDHCVYFVEGHGSIMVGLFE